MTTRQDPGVAMDEAELVAELKAWRSGRRRRSWPVIDAVPDVVRTAAALARSSWDEEGDHGELMRSAAGKLMSLYEVAQVLLADRDRERASRQDWAAEAVRLSATLRAPRSHAYINDPEDSEICWRCDQTESSQIHAEPYGQYRIAPADGAPCACITDDQAAALGTGFSRPVCAVHPAPSDLQVAPSLGDEELLAVAEARAATDSGVRHSLDDVDPLCVLDESNDMEAFAALPECDACGGLGKQVPDDFWGGDQG